MRAIVLTGLLALTSCGPPEFRPSPRLDYGTQVSYRRFPPSFQQIAPDPPPQNYTTTCNRDFVGNVVCNAGPGTNGLNFISTNPAIKAYQQSFDLNAEPRHAVLRRCMAATALELEQRKAARDSEANRPFMPVDQGGTWTPDQCQPPDVKGYLCKH